ncbi:hypothetical protein BDV30DRAFT_240175 [Aspergillus minisclerotigenes]|uniref:Isopenicillin N synthase-like Fe(2+) 2OG dioxygenase domain-containing protein n=1 Tax=Aspergillus minisclerotigenes TaxID=656917 RepID=A0A5N6IZB7_9EURO|nr:hypothetical protein BDV30DRAFT_240175 [Aspergillus minisclerotigenes]
MWCPDLARSTARSEATPTDGKVETFLKTHLNDKHRDQLCTSCTTHRSPQDPKAWPGLQVLSPTTGDWEWVHTQEGHGIVNIGDTLRFLSGEWFRSALHRVLPLTDEDAAQPYDRYSTAYFVRAADDAVFIGNDGKRTTADEWFLRKFHSFTQDRSVQRLDSVAFGGIEKSLGVKV